MTTAIATSNVEILNPSPQAITPYDMVTQAVMNGASVEVVGKLLDLHERWEANRARKAFDAAMSDAKAEIGPIHKNRQVKFESKSGGAKTDYRHEDLAEVARTVDPILAKHGLSYRFQTEQSEGFIKVTCVVSHRDGHAERNQLFANSDNSGNKNSIQAIGSTITYLQRYTLKAALGLAASNDDDGKSAEQTADEARAISEEHVSDILELLAETNSNLPIFLKYFGVEDVSQIPAAKYQVAVAKLNAKKAMQAKEASNG